MGLTAHSVLLSKGVQTLELEVFVVKTVAGELRKMHAETTEPSKGQSADSTFPQTKRGTTIGSTSITRLGKEIQISPSETFQVAVQLLKLADGALSMNNLSQRLGIGLEDLNRLCRTLDDEGFLYTHRPGDAIPARVFLKEFRMLANHWVDEIFSDPVWDDVVAGACSPAILVGWAIESMHYTRTVVQHMTLASARCEGVSSTTIARHFSEEWDHYVLFCDACESVGISREDLLNAEPLVSTQAITTFMRRVASNDPLVYNGCEALLEATAKDPDSVVKFFHSAGESHAYPTIFTGNIVSHVRADEEFEHIDIFDELLLCRTDISAEQADKILQACHALTALLTLWHADIIHHYRQFDVTPFPVRTRRISRDRH